MRSSTAIQPVHVHRRRLQDLPAPRPAPISPATLIAHAGDIARLEAKVDALTLMLRQAAPAQVVQVPMAQPIRRENSHTELATQPSAPLVRNRGFDVRTTQAQPPSTHVMIRRSTLLKMLD